MRNGGRENPRVPAGRQFGRIEVSSLLFPREREEAFRRKPYFARKCLGEHNCYQTVVPTALNGAERRTDDIRYKMSDLRYQISKKKAWSVCYMHKRG
jgi:hypothetical protein